ncbi:MAG: F0F1 ATP synthase subunit epsilon [Deltaproteobacteria bacterium]|nr:F0F1 ATP synthase subunit epsilon [Deltaproteobacteria bacterium]
MPLKLAIVTPEHEALQVECTEVVAPGVRGEIGFLPGHVPLITALAPGVLTVFQGNKKTYYAVSTGYAEIERDSVTILTDSCEEASKIDQERAKKAFAEAEGKLQAVGPDDPTYAEMFRRLARARARLDALARRN